jgi:hypothetical protein
MPGLCVTTKHYLYFLDGSPGVFSVDSDIKRKTIGSYGAKMHSILPAELH